MHSGVLGSYSPAHLPWAGCLPDTEVVPGLKDWGGLVQPEKWIQLHSSMHRRLGRDAGVPTHQES